MQIIRNRERRRLQLATLAVGQSNSLISGLNADDTVAGVDANTSSSDRGAGRLYRDVASPETPYVAREGYQPSKRSKPFAFLASCGAILGIVGAMATLNIVAKHHERSRLTSVDVRDLDITPPPPPPQAVKPLPVEPAVSKVTVPRPQIELPSAGPVQVMSDTPPPPVPPVIVSEVSRASAGPAQAVVAAPAATTVEGGDLSSKVLSAKPPIYPAQSRREREQGVVKLLVVVGTNGSVQDIQVASSSGSHRLDRAALQAVKQWRWSPTISGGVPSIVRGYVTIPFVLVAN